MAKTHTVIPTNERYKRKTRIEGYPRTNRPSTGRKRISHTTFKKIKWKTDQYGQLTKDKRIFTEIPESAIKPAFRSYAGSAYHIGKVDHDEIKELFIEAAKKQPRRDVSYKSKKKDAGNVSDELGIDRINFGSAVTRQIRIKNTTTGKEVFREVTPEQHEQLLKAAAENNEPVEIEFIKEREL